jgi:hypothetical protein
MSCRGIYTDWVQASGYLENYQQQPRDLKKKSEKENAADAHNMTWARIERAPH